MGVAASEVGYTSATARRGDHEISYENVVALGRGEKETATFYGRFIIMFTRYSVTSPAWFVQIT